MRLYDKKKNKNSVTNLRAEVRGSFFYFQYNFRIRVYPQWRQPEQVFFFNTMNIKFPLCHVTIFYLQIKSYGSFKS